MKLIKFELSLRGTDLCLAAIVDEEEWKLLENKMKSNYTVYLGEVAGKHSAVNVELEENDFKILSEDPNEIAVFQKLFGNEFGNISISYFIEDEGEE